MWDIKTNNLYIINIQIFKKDNVYNKKNRLFCYHDDLNFRVKVFFLQRMIYI
jgi:hypothetical protein